MDIPEGFLNFYFAYGLDRTTMTANKVCRCDKMVFLRFDWKEEKWVDAPSYASILWGQGRWDYDEITEEEALQIIENVLKHRN